MGELSEDLLDKKPAKWSPFRLFDWIDRFKSESRRRVFQTLIGGSILAVCGILCQHTEELKKFPNWFLSVLQSPIQVSIWVLSLFILIPLCVFGFIYWIHNKNKKIQELESVIKERQPKTAEQILNRSSQRNELKKRELIIKIVDLMKSENRIDLKYDPIGALIKYSDEMESENDVKLICDELVKHHYTHPFELIEKASDNALEGKWLKVLREARLNSIELRRQTQLLDFLTSKWSEKENWIAAKNRRNNQIQNAQSIPIEFANQYSQKIPHKCSLCGFTYMIQNPILITSGDAKEKPFVTCPQKACRQIDFLRSF